VILDLEHIIAGQRNVVRQSFLCVRDAYTITGYRISSSTWCNSRHLYFAARFSQPIVSHAIWDGNRQVLYPGIKERASGQIKASFHFDTQKENVLYLKVAVRASMTTSRSAQWVRSMSKTRKAMGV
jgi:putative alpha-1,2-mannosidase